MAQFDVYRLRSGAELVLDCQADVLHGSERRFVIPLLPAGSVPRPLPRLTPVFVVNGEEHVLTTLAAASIPRTEIGPTVGSLADQRDQIIAAIDMLVTGF